MSSPSKKKFIVLIHRVPYGPLDEAQVQLLLAKQILSYNDFLMEHGEGPSRWQFVHDHPSFNRRQSRSKPTLERRVITQKEKDKLAEERIPLDLSQVAIDDLVLRAEKTVPQISLSADSRPYSNIDLGKEESKIHKLVAGGVGMFLVAFVFTLYQWAMLIPEPSKPNLSNQEVNAKPSPERAPSSATSVLENVEALAIVPAKREITGDRRVIKPSPPPLEESIDLEPMDVASEENRGDSMDEEDIEATLSKRISKKRRHRKNKFAQPQDSEVEDIVQDENDESEEGFTDDGNPLEDENEDLN